MNGIGGRTIAEAQENMSYSEFQVWMKFRQRRGSLHQGMRVEMAIAEALAHHFNWVRGEKATRLYQQDFAPHMDPRIESLEEAQASWA